jgi:hypothetical protein
MAVALGLSGKLVLDARQVTVVNETITPTKSDLEWLGSSSQSSKPEAGSFETGAIGPGSARGEDHQSRQSAWKGSVTSISGECDRRDRTEHPGWAGAYRFD